MQSIIKSLFFCLFLSLVSVDGTYIKIISSKTGRKFDGIGAISGGGATSKLLVNYNSQIQSTILDYLFKPGYGAALHMLKVEMGGDVQSTEGSEASHMHNPWDENYFRGYEWWLMKEAKKRNPNITLLGLPWGFPRWVAHGSSTPYANFSTTATYVVKWLLGAKKYHNLSIDYMGIWNEKPYNLNYVKYLRSLLNRNGLNHVRLVVGDGSWKPADDMKKDPLFAKSFDVIGAHYPGTVSTESAKASGKSLWASEDYSTYSDSIGAACWAKIINRNYVQGLMTSTIAWNLLTSYYDNLPYPRASLMVANEPWSGHFEVPGSLWVTAHTAHFTKPGWIYAAHGSGVDLLKSGGSVVTLFSPDKKHVTIILETMTFKHSKCVRPPLPPYNVTEQSVKIDLSDFQTPVNTLRMYISNISVAFVKYFQRLPDIKVQNRTLVLTLVPDSLITLTTLPASEHTETYSAYRSPASAPFPLPYKDNFEKYAINSEAYYLTPQAGYFEVVPNPSSKGQKCVSQVVLEPPIYWCFGGISAPNAVFGPGNWKSINVQLSVMLPSVNASTGVFLATRMDRGGCFVWMAQGVFVWLLRSEARLEITADLMRSQSIFSMPMEVQLDQFYHLQIQDKGASVNVFLDGQKVTSVSPPPVVPQKGFVGLGTDNYGLAFFDDLAIESEKEDTTLTFRSHSSGRTP